MKPILALSVVFALAALPALSAVNASYTYVEPTSSGVAFCMTCGDDMPGKSANGRNGKIPYYEHS